MRVVISGTHGSGKSTLISDFALLHSTWMILPDPYEDVDTAEATPGASLFAHQLRIAAHRLGEPADGHVIAERGPLDFVAYLIALDDLRRSSTSAELTGRSIEVAAEAMRLVDLLVVLPLSEVDAIEIGDDEDLELRDAMNLALLDLVDDPELTGGATVVEITGNQQERLARLLESIAGISRR
ncbi:MAG: AAA family ATPase [Rhodoglobus sp.]